MNRSRGGVVRAIFPAGRSAPTNVGRYDRRCAAPLAWIGLILLLGLISNLTLEGSEPRPGKTNYASLKVTGCGFLENLQLARTIRLARADKGKMEYFDAAFIEDAALTILSKVTDDGYLEPQIRASVWDAAGREEQFTWDEDFNTMLPATVRARAVRFRVELGVRSYYQGLAVEGLHALKDREVRAFFFPTGFLFKSKHWRPFTPDRLDRSIASLKVALARLGYNDTTVTVLSSARDLKTGGVDVQLRVTEGLPSYVRSVRIEGASSTPSATGSPSSPWPSTGRSGVRGNDPSEPPYSDAWANEYRFQLQTNELRRGFLDAKVSLAITNRATNDTSVQLDLLAAIARGPAIKLGRVRFAGEFDTVRSVLDSRIQLKPGEPLDRLKAEDGRNRLSRLGIFDQIDLQYEPVDEQTRDVVYRLQAAKTLDFNLLLGWGSYELLRGGFELEERNVWHRAHAVRLRGVQSFKSSSGDVRYTIPELVSRDVDLYLQGAALRREEVSFDREEFGGGVGVDRYFRELHTRASLRYDHEFLTARDAPGEVETNGVNRTRAAAFILDLTSDRRDNPLVPHKGLKLGATLEYASDYFGGQVDYQRMVFAGSFHQGLGGGRFLHLGVTHGLTFTWGGASDDLPFNKRFFPGGESSVRGYQQGEAAPRDANRKVIGAETYLEGNLELEQMLTPNWSIVGFADGVAFAADRSNYPAEEELYSVGGGLRWRTLIGPVRLEYGRNINPRRGDPAGTLHFAIGFPF